MSGKINLLDLHIEDVEKLIQNIGQQKFRAKQIFKWVNSGIKDIDEMTDLSKALREELKNIAYISSLEIVNKLESRVDGTIKYLFRLNDGNVIESVLMEYKYGKTACITTQVGCKMGCKFCASTGIGFDRNLTSGEILDQIITIQKDIGQNLGNIVLMGIGEPFDNFENVLKFLKIINYPFGMNISQRRITISTCGLVPQIIELAKEKIPVNLSISLHGPNNDIRSKLMPINNKYPIEKLMEACKIYIKSTNRRITFEYAMLQGINDYEKSAYELAKLTKGMLCHVNLIPINSVEGTGFQRTSRKKTEKFKSILESFGIQTTIRRELGEDINAACGQLRKNSLKN